MSVNDETQKSILHSRCPTCGKQHRIQDKYLGKQAKCNQCHTKFTVTPVEQNGSSDKAETKPLETQVWETHVSEPTSSEKEPSRRSGIASETEPTLKTINRFQVKAIVGAGAHGIVYRAYDPVLRRQVALKEPKFDIRDQRKRRRFMIEAKSAAQLRHPNIVAVFDGGETEEGKPYIAAEFIDGRPLSAFIDQPDVHCVSLETKVGWVMELAGALAYAHSEGIIHRDIKPDNILVERDSNRPQITDFGLAKQLDEVASAMTNDGTVLGTPVYMSPEQARGQLDLVGPQSDQYSLGVVLYELLTGKTPYHGEPYAVVAAVAGPDEPPAVRTLNPEITKDLAAICDKAMEKESEHRYPNCAEFAADLQRWLVGDTVVARPQTITTRMLRWTRRHPATILASTGGLLVIMLTVGLILLARYQGELKLALERAKAAEENAITLADSNAKLAEKEKQTASQERQERLRAEKAEESAKSAQKEAEAAGAEERKERIRAEQAERDAKAAQVEAEEARATALAAQRKLDRHLATARIKSADILMQNSEMEVVRALQLLDEVPEPHRSWDWNFLRARQGNPIVNAVLSESDGQCADTCFDSTGTRLAVAQQFAAHVVEVETGEPLISFMRPENFHFSRIMFSSDDRLILTAGFFPDPSGIDQWNPRRKDLGRITVWDAATGTEIRSFNFDGTVSDVCISPDGSLIAGALAKGGMILGNIGSGNIQIVRPQDSNTRYTSGIAFNSASSKVIAADGRKIDILDIDRIHTIEFHVPRGHKVASRIALDPGRTNLAYGDENGRIHVIDLNNGKTIHSFRAHTDGLYSVSYHPTQDLLVTIGRQDGFIRLWSKSKGESLGAIHAVDAGVVKLNPIYRNATASWGPTEIGPGEIQLAANMGSTGCLIFALDRIDHLPDQTLPLSEKPRLIRSVQFSEDSGQLLFEGRYGPVVLDASTGSLQNRQQSSVDTMDVTVDVGVSKLLKSYTDGRVDVVDAASNTHLKTIQVAEIPVSRLQISRDGDTLACLLHERDPVSDKERSSKLSLWSLNTSTELWTIDDPGVAAGRPVFSLDGKIVGVNFEGQSIKLWESKTGTFVNEFVGDISEFAISPKADVIAVGSEIGFITLWDIKSGDKLGELSAGFGPVASLAFASDGRRFASMGNDGHIHLWDLDTLQETISFTLPELKGESPRLCFSPDGRWLTCSTDQVAYFWDAQANW